MLILLMVVGYVITYILQKMIYQMLIDGGAICENYRGENIPFCMGIALMLSFLITCILGIFMGLVKATNLFMTIFAGSVVGACGLIDDFIGSVDYKGFRGHIGSLLRGKLTTGGIKAAAGVLVALIVSAYLSNNIYDVIINIFLIALVTNFINLLDTRPGRAVKGFIFFTIIIAFLGNISVIHYILLSVLIAYLPIDLKAKGMLGDTGSNFIGIILGIGMVQAIKSIIVRLIILSAVLFLNLISERYSFTKIIENNKFLKFIDMLGRK